MSKEALWYGLLSFKYGDLDKVVLSDYFFGWKWQLFEVEKFDIVRCWK